MKKVFKTFLLLVVASCIGWGIDAQPRSTTKQITLFGIISSVAGTEEMAGLPIFYKGGEYTVVADKENEIKKAHYELYDDQKPQQLYVLIVKNLKRPCENCLEHLEVESGQKYKLYKLTKQTVEMPDIDPIETLKKKQPIEWRDSWHAEEIQLKDGETIPDNCVIIFMDPDFVDHLEVKDWLSSGTTMKIPSIILKDNVSKRMIRAMRDEVLAGYIDFRAFHKKPFKAIVPFAQNRLISMPFTPRGYNC